MVDFLSSPIPSKLTYIGYDGNKSDGKNIHLEEFSLPTSNPPKDDDALVYVTHSSVNPVDWKLAIYNWSGRKEFVGLGMDLAGRVVKVGKNVTHVKEGDDVVGTVDWSAGDGVWVSGGKGGYQAMNKDIVTKRYSDVPPSVAGCYGTALLTAWDAIKPNLKENQKVYIPGGAGGVAHYAIQFARTYSGVEIVSSASRPESTDIAKKAGANYIFDYKKEIPADAVKKAFNGQLSSFVFDSTYSPESFFTSAEALAEHGTLVILGDTLPDKNSPIHDILESKDGKLVQADMIRYFNNPEYIKKRNNGFLIEGFQVAMKLYTTNQMKPIITKTIDCTLSELQTELELSQNGKGFGKVAVNLVY